MDGAAMRDLRCYHTARLLQLVPQLHRTQEENCFLLPLFFSCVSAEAKRHARLILLCLYRYRFSPAMAGMVLSYLSFPEFVSHVGAPVAGVKHPREDNQTEKEETHSTETDSLFFVRPPPSRSGEAITHLFVRMVPQYPLNEEMMNTYFGRYGQVSCALLRQHRVADDAFGQRHMQDFIVTVDSTHNAMQAVRGAYYRELAFIALHDPSLNVYGTADVDALFADTHIDIVAEPSAPQKEDDDTKAAHSLRPFVPDVIVDGLPYWLTVDQLRASFSDYGRVEAVRLSIDDRSGAFTGAALLRMSSVAEALAAAEGLHGTVIKGHTLVSGVLDDRLNIVSFRNGTIIRRAEEDIPEMYNITENDRQWV